MFSDPREESSTEVLLRRADLVDKLEEAESHQRRRRRTGLSLVAFGVISFILGLTFGGRWFFYAVSALQIPIFGFGLFLMAGQEVKRLRREVESLEAEVGFPEPGLESGESGEE